MLRRLEKGEEEKKENVTEQYLTGIQTSNDFKKIPTWFASSSV